MRYAHSRTRERGVIRGPELMIRLLILASLLFVTACTDRTLVQYVPAGIETRTRPVLVATTRAPDPEQPGIPGWARSETLGFGRFDISIPSDRDPGGVSRPGNGQSPDPARHFLMASVAPMSRAGFVEATRRALNAVPGRQREAVIFVHGYNVTFADGVYRTAQMAEDLDLPGVMMHYSWPSLGAPLAYAHDRDSVLFARDGLVDMVRTVQEAGATRIVLIAHSMGSHLVMEALRQMSLSRDPARRALAGVLLLSPDLDIEVFRSQARSIDGLPQPFIIVTSRRDRVLRLSAGLTGESARLGNLSDPARVEGMGVTLFDVSAFSEGAGHFTVGDSTALIALMDQVDLVDTALSGDQNGRIPLLPATILTLQNTTQIILEPLTEGGQRRPLRWWLLPRGR